MTRSQPKPKAPGWRTAGPTPGLPKRTRGTGTRRHSGWPETIPLSAFLEAELGRKMQGKSA